MDKSNPNLPSIYLIAPSGIPQNKLSCQNGINWLFKNGYSISNSDCLNREFQRFAGNDDQRLDEINSINQNVKSNSIVMSVRGGYGINRLLSKIHWDNLSLAVKNGIKLIGHSDFTALSIALFAKKQAISFSGPMLSYDFGIDDLNDIQISKFTWDHFQDVVAHNCVKVTSNTYQPFLTEEFEISIVDHAILWGGNLTMLVGLIGTPFFPNLDMVKNGILYLEDVNEHPYRIERMLWQLVESGFLQSQSAIILGDFSAFKLSPSDNGYDLQCAIERINKELINRGARTKILTGLPLGHIRDKVTLPVGAIGTLTASPHGFNLRSSW